MTVINARPPVGRPKATSLVVCRDINKSFGGVQALKGVSIDIAPGEVHGLVGANGAGKSTLIRVFAGLIRPDTGTIEVDGQVIDIATPAAATALGMSFIHQELAFVPGMTVLQNIMLGIPKRQRFGMVDWKSIARDIAPIAKRVGITAPLNASVKSLSTAENWLINICRALVRKARLIVMDEPTASLSTNECEKLFAIVRDLSASGVSVLYVSHRLDEIMDLCNRVTVMRDGCTVAQLQKSQLTRATLVEAIVGGIVHSEPMTRHQSTVSKVMLSVEKLSRNPRVKEVSFDLYAGEVLGIGGLVGAGRSELARLLFGVDQPDAGQMSLAGKRFSPKSPKVAVKAGVGLVPEERRTEGLVMSKSIAFNLSLANLDHVVISPMLPVINSRARTNLALSTIKALAIKANGLNTPVGRLSGGNQQKVVIGRWIQRSPLVLILDEPTRGVDIGARAEIHRLIRDLASKGMAVLVISSEPDELPDLCDRALVMVEGRITAELKGQALTRKAIVEACYSQTPTRIKGP